MYFYSAEILINICCKNINQGKCYLYNTTMFNNVK